MSDLAALTVDFELFQHTPAYRSAKGSTDREGIGLDGGAFLRSALERHDATATYFVVSAVAEAYPEAVETLGEAGHEIASHTHTHRLLTDLDVDEQREELRRSKEVLESTTDEPVTGFRAPAFDFGPAHFRLLEETGYEYDASVVPSRRIPGWYGGEYEVTRPVPATSIDADAPAGLSVVPAGVMPGVGLPLTGTWLRFFGVRYTILGMKLLARRGIAPVLYVHPWELVDLPAVDGVPKRVSVRTGAWMRRAVERILEQPFTFTTVREVLASADLDGTGEPRRGEP